MRVGSRHAPSMTLQQHNARKMYRKNEVAVFIRSCLSAEDKKYLRRRAREIDSSGVAKKEHNANTAAHKATLLVKQKADEVRMTVRVQKKAQIDVVNPRLDAEVIRKAPGTVKEIDLELD